MEENCGPDQSDSVRAVAQICLAEITRPPRIMEMDGGSHPMTRESGDARLQAVRDTGDHRREVAREIKTGSQKMFRITGPHSRKMFRIAGLHNRKIIRITGVHRQKIIRITGVHSWKVLRITVANSHRKARKYIISLPKADHKLRQINVQGNWNQQRNPGPSGVDQNSPNQQMADTGINTSQPTKSQTNKKPVKTKNTSNAGVSVSSGSSGFYLFDFLTRMFRKSNISVIIYLILNVALVCGFTVLFVPDNIPLGIVIGIVLYLVSVTIALSPIGEWYLRFQTRCKKLKRTEDINRLEPIFREVYAKAKQKDPSLNSSIQLYITDDDSPNAFATGRKTVCVTRGLLNMPDEQIRATLGHEFGHLAHKDTDLILLISVGNMFVNMLVTFFNIGLWFFDIITTIMCLFMGGEDGFITHLFMIFSRFLAVITVNLLLRIWTGLGTLLVMKSSRGNEFEADEFAFQLGYGDQLCALLDYFSTHEQKASGLFAALASSHPDSHDRIARLQQLGAGYYR